MKNIIYRITTGVTICFLALPFFVHIFHFIDYRPAFYIYSALTFILIATAPPAWGWVTKTLKWLFAILALSSIYSLYSLGNIFASCPAHGQDVSGCAALGFIFGQAFLGSLLLLPISIVGFILTNWRAWWTRPLNTPAQTPESKRKNNIIAATIITGVFLVFIAYDTIEFIAGTKDSNTVHRLNAPASAPPSGFLIPTTQSIPEGFKEIKIDRPYTGGSYEYRYSMPTQGKTAVIDVTEAAVYASSDGNYKQSYENDLTNVMGNRIPSSPVITFTYENSPGIIVSPYGYGETDPTVTNYSLHWNDQGRDLTIQAVYVPKSLVTPDTLINMLKTFVRQP